MEKAMVLETERLIIETMNIACLDATDDGRPRKPDSLYVEGVRP